MKPILHQSEVEMRKKYPELQDKCPKCDRPLIMTGVGKWCPNPDCKQTTVKSN